MHGETEALGPSISGIYGLSDSQEFRVSFLEMEAIEAGVVLRL